MKTEVEMKRELFGIQVKQKSKTEFFHATDVVRAGNKWRYLNGMSPFNLSGWMKQKSTLEFMEELKLKYGTVYTKSRGRNGETWVHPLLFIDIALAINPKLKVEVYEWLFDHLIKRRNDSGDSYKKMCGNLYVRHGHKATFPNYITTVANRIKIKCQVTDWQKANEEQLKLRDKLHNDIALLANVFNDNDQALRIALEQN